MSELPTPAPAAAHIAAPQLSAQAGAPPVTSPRPQPRTIHGFTIDDDYAWLRADNWREVLRDPTHLPQDIRSVLEAENVFSAKVLEPLGDLREALFSEMRGRIREDDSEAPLPDGPYEYYQRYREGGEHELVCRKKRGGEQEEILLDGDALGAGKAFFSLGAAEVSPDHRLLAWSADDKGSEYHTIRIRDLASGADLEDIVGESDGEIVWSADGLSIFYVRLDENHRPKWVLQHKLGAPASSDALIYEELDSGWFVHIHRDASRRFCVIALSDHDSSETRLIDLAARDAPPLLVEPRQRGVRYDAAPHGERLFIRTNADCAEDFKIAEAPLASPGKANWRDVAAHRQGCMIAYFAVYEKHLVRLEREDSLPRIVVREIASGQEHSIAFDEEAYALSINGTREYNSSLARFTYSSMTTPRETYDYDMASRQRRLVKQQEIPSGHDAAKYVTRRVFAIADDGERVPVSLLHLRDAKLDGSAPLFLSGYGAYGHAYSASFSTARLSLADRGFVYAIAHVRGGTDKGWAWYENGKLAKKKNTFGDFIAVARHLVWEKFTSEGSIVASGGSAGGMLMGAVVNMAPELFAGIIADVPFVDVINTMMDTDLPLTPPEWLEWGNPIEDAAAFACMLAYSPYDNVKAQAYPPILALAGLTDPRVTYWEPAKWVARLRAHATGGGPILLKTNMDAGHGGASGRFDSIRDTALEYAFAIACANGRRTPGA